MSSKLTWRKKSFAKFAPQYPQDARPLKNGNLLISGHSNRKLTEIDPDGKPVWELDARQRWIEQAVRLENGNTLIAEATQQNPVVSEVNLKGERVWEYIVPSRNSLDSIQALDNGNVLISIIGSAIEVNKQSKAIVWRIDKESLRDAYRLKNGNTLILAKDRVLEVDPNGKELWSKAGMNYGTVRR